MPETMKAALIRDENGFNFTDVPFPVMKDGDILIKIHAAGVNRADIMQRHGTYPPPPGWPEWPGLEVAGEVYAVSEKAKKESNFKVGDRVAALVGGGGYAEYITTHYSTLIRLPDELSYVDGACLPEVYSTAYLNLFGEGKLQKGETVLVFAGASGIGIAVTQIAKAFGAKVIATVRSDEKAEAIRDVGADLIVNTKKTDIVSVFEENGVDLVIDCVGGEKMGACFSRMNRFGRWIMIAALGGKDSTVDLAEVYKKRLRLIGSTLRSRSDEEKHEILTHIQEEILPYIVQGKFKPKLYAVLPLSDADGAHKIVEANQNIGKVILRVCE